MNTLEAWAWESGASMVKTPPLRRLVELAYLYAWGKDGNADIRDEFRQNFSEVKSSTGVFTYEGAGKFRWVGGK